MSLNITEVQVRVRRQGEKQFRFQSHENDNLLDDRDIQKQVRTNDLID